MFSLTAAVLLTQVVSSVGVLLMARHSVQLVDDQGRAMARTGDWHERVVPVVASSKLEV